MEGVVVSIAFFGTILAVVYLHYTTRNRERMALIEKGADASLFYAKKANKEINGHGWSMLVLKTGMFLMGIAVGVIMGGVLSRSNVLNEGVNYTSMILFFGGLSLVLSYLIKPKTDR